MSCGRRPASAIAAQHACKVRSSADRPSRRPTVDWPRPVTAAACSKRECTTDQFAPLVSVRCCPPCGLAALRPGDSLVGIRCELAGQHDGEMTPPHGRPRSGELAFDAVPGAGGLRWVGVSESVPLFEEFDWAMAEVADYRVVVSLG